MHSQLILLSFFIKLLCFTQVLCQICTNYGYTYEKHLGSKSPYRIVANNTFGKIEYEGCTPSKIWMMVRHGTRTPNAQLITIMQTRLTEIRNMIVENNPVATDYLRNTDLDAFRKWEVKLLPENQKLLTHEGEDEMVGLAERMQSKFPTLFDKAYSNTSYQFKYTDTSRTKKSAKYFATGLFGKATAKKVWYPQPSKKDPILRFYKLCSKWRKDISKNISSLIERKKFENSTTVQQMVTEITDRLQLRDGELNFADIHAMYMTCAFETAWNKRKRSPWCSVFTINNLKLMEYAEDLKYYWVDGYGYELTYRQACTAFNNMMDLLTSKDKNPKVTVYFTHSGTLLKIFAHLGLYKEDTKLKADNYKEFLDDRNWRVSLIDAFGSNLAFVLFKCEESQKILTLHQEQVIRLPSCASSDLCDIETISNYYKKSIEKCSFDEMCENS